MCPHGINIPFVPIGIVSQQTVHDGGSNSLPFFLQCLFSILTTGNFPTASLLALYFLALASASYSLILRTISKKSSSVPLPADAKF